MRRAGHRLSLVLAALLFAAAPAVGAAQGGREAPALDFPQAYAPGQGQSVERMSQQELSALTSKLSRLWNPDCRAAAAGDVVVKVRMSLTQDRRLAAPPVLVWSSGAPEDVVASSARRALAAVETGQPYAELKPEHYAHWRDMIVNFNAKQACAKP